MASKEPDNQPRLRLLPRGILALSTVVFFMGLAAAFTGAVLYAYYESRLEHTEKDLDEFVGQFSGEVEDARAVIQAEGQSARNQIDAQLNELQQFSAGGETLTSLLTGASPSVWFVSTLDETGAPSVGTAFVVFADPNKSYLLTSYSVVSSGTQEPTPTIELRQGDQVQDADLITWDPGHDLALVSIPLGDQPALTFVEDPGSIAIGDRMFAVSGLGATGASVVQGVVSDNAGNAIQHDAPIGAAFRGGPLLNSSGQVIGVASRTYAPMGFDPLAVFFAPHIRAACETVISCPDGNAAPPG